MEGPLATRRLLASGDADRVRDAVGALAVPHDVLVERGPPTIAGLVNGARLRRVSVVYVRYGARVRVEAPATHARLALTVPLGPMRVATGGTGPGTVHTAGFLLDAERDTIMRPSPWLGALVVTTDRRALEDQLHTVAGVAADGPLRFGAGAGRALLPDGLRPEAWRALVGQLDALGPGDEDGPVGRHLEDVLLTAMLLGLPHSASALLHPPEPRPAPVPSVERARAHLEAHHAEPLTTADLARAVGASARHLQAGFRARYGQTPMQVLREVRLQHARAALLAGRDRDDRTVAEVAAACGFAHLGRFAVQYRERFGERPSETRRTART